MTRNSVKAGVARLTTATAITALATSAMAADMAFTGAAKTGSGQLLYEERHELAGSCQDGVFRPQNHQIRYYRADQTKPFASKDLTYPDSLIRPTVDFAQPDFDESLRIDYPSGEALNVAWRTPAGETKRFEVALSDDLVVDAGFDTLVRRHWDTVTSGGSVDFRFLAPTRGKHYEFVLEPVQNSRVEADYTLQIRPTGVVLRFLVDPIILGYNSNGALTDYFGLTNIRKDEDSNYTAHIRYTVSSYPDCELTP